MNRTRKLGMKLGRMTMGGRRFAYKINVEAVKTVQDAVRVFRIMVFLHSAKDSPFILKLYGAEDSSVTD